jgi:hypothetical protein
MTFFTGELKKKFRVAAFDGREVFEKGLQCVVSREIVQKGLGLHPRAFENQGSTQNPGIGGDRAVIESDHDAG